MGMGILLTNYGFRLLKLTESKELSGFLQVLQWIVNRARVSWECSQDNNAFQDHMAQIKKKKNETIF